MIEEKIASLNLSLPSPPKPAGSYIPVVQTGNLVFVSGQIPVRDNKVEFQGKVPTDVSVERAQEAAKLCVINILAQLKSEIKSLDKISRIICLSGFVNSAPDFADHPKIINSASDLLYEIFGEIGRHSRISVGVSSLPLNSTVEIDLVVEVSRP
ncbi:MAG: RidA family protein [Thaumarchaeota archaeon]|nr:RidA family protein [Nitrososphaerota archaeon]